MDAFSDPSVETVVVMTSSQVGKTTVMENVIGYHIDQDPSPILAIQPTLEMAETFSKDRLAPMLRDTPCLRGKVKDARARDSGNTLLHKQFPGGHITMAGANSPASLASRPIRIVLCDEVDRYPASAGTEGDPVLLAKKRTTTFWNRKIGLFSTPTIRGASRIEAAYEQSDKRRFFVPCHQCGEMQALVWSQAKWTEAADAAYECFHCGARWDDAARWKALRHGEWRAGAEFRGIAGFHLNELYSPWSKLASMVEAFQAAKDYPEQLKTWINTCLGESWQQAGDAPEWERIAAHAEDYTLGQVPDGVRFLTAGIDIQKNRCEMAVWGWGRNRRRWLVDYIVIPGELSDAATKTRLTDEINTTYQTSVGVDLPIARVAVDSGYAAEEVYAWARQQSAARVLVIKGDDRAQMILGSPKVIETTPRGKRAKWGVKVWPMGAGHCKAEFYGQLRLQRDEASGELPAGWVTIPARGWTEPTLEEFCRQAVAEQYVIRMVKGYKRGEWVKTRERNEALDTANMARAAAEHIGLSRMSEREWARMDAPFGAPATPAATRVEAAQPAAQQQPAQQPAQSRSSTPSGGYWGGRSWSGF